MNKFKLIYVDPPTRFVTRSAKGGGRSPKYPTMTFEELTELPVRAVADDDCVLLLWTTFPVLPQSIRLGMDWGFWYKTVAFSWVKVTKQGMRAKTFRPIPDNYNWAIGLGYWTRANSEICLLFTRGNPQRKSKSVRQLIVAPAGRHSEKPSETYERIEALVDGPFLELFARRRREGWSSLGNEVDGQDIRDSLNALISDSALLSRPTIDDLAGELL